ncbi:MAG: FkbM family methyltransferase [Phycisphaerae bacterium]
MSQLESIISDGVEGQSHGVFIDIGAHDGITEFNGKPTCNVYKYACEGWSGVMVEPNPWIFAKLAEHYATLPRVLLVRCAVAGVRGHGTLFGWKDPAIGCSSLDEATAHREAVTHGLSECVHIRVPLLSPSDVICIAGSHIDLLSIDAEGSDASIINAWPFRDCKPRVIVCEINKLSWTDQADERIFSYGYNRVFTDDINRVWFRS